MLYLVVVSGGFYIYIYKCLYIDTYIRKIIKKTLGMGMKKTHAQSIYWRYIGKKERKSETTYLQE